MRREPPRGFRIEEFYCGINVFQSWEVFPGLRTGGPKDVAVTLDSLDFPKDLTGKRVLDIGPWNGFFTFECVRRGAAEVVALGPDDPDATGFSKTLRLLEIPNVRYIIDSLYNVPKLSLGSFDLVLFLGIIYHLRYPLLALDYIHDCCNGYLYADCPIIDEPELLILSPEKRKLVTANWNAIRDLPIVYYAQQDEQVLKRDLFNWSFPTARALHDWIISSGFVVEHEVQKGNWSFIKGRKGARNFVLWFEGHNPGVLGA
ncbi:MAG: class I SAM-dependent methyltransferase [Stellaceae bacterium]